MESNEKNLASPKKIWSYLVFCFVLTWSAFFVIMFNGGLENPNGKVAVAFCMLIPSVAVLLVMLTTKEGVKNLFVHPHFKGNVKYYLLAWLVPAAMTVLGAAIYFLVFPKHLDITMKTFCNNMMEAAQQTSSPDALQKLPSVESIRLVAIAQLAMGLILSPILNFIPCFGEELGWRGFLLPRLTARFNGNKIKAVLLTGFIWGLWHAPVTYMGHNYGTEYPFFPFAGILMMIVFCTTLGTFMAAIFYKTKSMIPAVITHAVINGFANGPLIFMSDAKPYTLLGPAICGLLGCSGFIVLAIVLLVKQIRKK
jgi:membrane protease YdiL (CAAX protease family)